MRIVIPALFTTIVTLSAVPAIANDIENGQGFGKALMYHARCEALPDRIVEVLTMAIAIIPRSAIDNGIKEAKAAYDSSPTEWCKLAKIGVDTALRSIHNKD